MYLHCRKKEHTHTRSSTGSGAVLPVRLTAPPFLPGRSDAEPVIQSYRI